MNSETVRAAGLSAATQPCDESLAAAGLARLETRLAEDLSMLELPAREWVMPRTHAGEVVLDVAVIGGGMAGLAAAAALKHMGVRVVIFDRAPQGLEGPWATTARMETLRSPKQLTGPALGLPALTFRAWYVAQFGNDAWQALDKIDRLQWMAYLVWYRRVLDLDVRNQHTIERVTPRADGLVALQIRALNADGSRSFELFARRVVLATGRDGLGGPAIPAFIESLPRNLWAHSSDTLDYRTLAGKRVAVVGAGASAMDSAATALEAGAASVDLLIRRPDLPRVNKGKGAGNPGLTHGHQSLPDAWKWQIRHYINTVQVPPPRGSTLRVSRHSNARFNLACPVQQVEVHAHGLSIVTPRARFAADFLIVSTGFKIDWASRPEFAPFAAQVAVWGSRYTPSAGQEDAELASFPDLGPAFEFQEKSPGACPGLSNIHCFCYPATLSHGQVSGDIPAISEGAQRLARGIAALLYASDVAEHYVALQAYAEPELYGDEWQSADLPMTVAP